MLQNHQWKPFPCSFDIFSLFFEYTTWFCGSRRYYSFIWFFPVFSPRFSISPSSHGSFYKSSYIEIKSTFNNLHMFKVYNLISLNMCMPVYTINTIKIMKLSITTQIFFVLFVISPSCHSLISLPAPKTLICCYSRNYIFAFLEIYI